MLFCKNKDNGALIYAWDYEPGTNIVHPITNNDVSFVKQSQPFDMCVALDYQNRCNTNCEECPYYKTIVRGKHFRCKNGIDIPCTIIQGKIYEFFKTQSHFIFKNKIKKISPLKLDNGVLVNMAITTKREKIIIEILNGRKESYTKINDEIKFFLENDFKILPVVIKEPFEVTNRIPQIMTYLKQQANNNYFLMLDNDLNRYVVDFELNYNKKTVGSKYYFPKTENKIFFKEINDIIVPIQKIKRIESKTCPICGGNLIKRKGKYGEFYGCSNFPKCRFTRKIAQNKWKKLQIKIDKDNDYKIKQNYN